MRADEITSPIESLSPEEKERLGFLVMWAMDGPEQGFINATDTMRLRVELADFLNKNGVSTGGQWLDEAQRLLKNK